MSAEYFDIALQASGLDKAAFAPMPGLQNAIGSFGKSIGTALQGGAAQAVGMGVVAVGTAAAHNAWEAATKGRDFRGMLEANPDVAAMHGADPHTVTRFYNSLRTLNPTFAKDPVVAGSYMRSMMEDPSRAGHQLVQSLAMAPPSGQTPWDNVQRAGLQGLGQGLDQQRFQHQQAQDAQHNTLENARFRHQQEQDTQRGTLEKDRFEHQRTYDKDRFDHQKTQDAERNRMDRNRFAFTRRDSEASRQQQRDIAAANLDINRLKLQGTLLQGAGLNPMQSVQQYRSIMNASRGVSIP
jgi:hypothetical protein